MDHPKMRDDVGCFLIVVFCVLCLGFAGFVAWADRQVEERRMRRIAREEIKAVLAKEPEHEQATGS